MKPTVKQFFLMTLAAIGIVAGLLEVARRDVGGQEAESVRRAESAGRYASVRLEQIPHIQQRPDFCGEACAAMFLRKLGFQYDQDDVFDLSGLAPEQGRGCYTPELVESLRRIGFSPGPVWWNVSPQLADRQLEGLFAQMHADLRRGYPSIVCMYYDDQPETTEHFRLVVGYDAQRDQVIYHEPAVRDGAYRTMSRSTFLKLWPLKSSDQRWTVIRMRLQAERLKRPPENAGGFTAADYAQAVRHVREQFAQALDGAIQLEATAMLPHILMTGSRFLARDRPSSAVELLALLASDRWSSAEIIRDANKQLERLAHQLPPGAFEAARARGESAGRWQAAAALHRLLAA